MSTNNTTSLAIVAEITGKVWTVAEDGTRHLLQKGDAVYEGDVILAEGGGLVVLRAASGAELKVTESKEVVLSDGLFEGVENTFSLNLRGLMAATDGAPDVGSIGLLDGVVFDQPVDWRSFDNLSESESLSGFLSIERVVESVTAPPYLLWSFTGNYNSSTNFRLSSYNPFLDGRATYDERIIMSLEPLGFTYEEPLLLQKTIVFAETPLLQPKVVSPIVPVVNDQTRQGYVEEEALTGGNSDTSDVSGLTGDNDGNNAVWSGTLSGLASFGADQPGTYTINMVTTGLPVLTSEGATVLYSVSGNVLTGYVESGGTSGYQSGEDRAIFTLSITDTTSGSYSFTLHDQLDHTYGDNTETLLDLNLSSAIQAKDRDGDQITLGSSALLITVQDDIPVQSDQTRQGYVEEEALTGGNTDTSDVSGLTGDNDDNNAVWSGTLSGLASFGADQPGTYTINMVTTGLPVLTSEGATVLYSVSGNVLTGYVESGGTSGYQSGEDRAIFTLSITDTTSGSYSFTLHDQLDHTYGDNTETLLDLNLSSAIQAKDRDGDQITLGSSALLITVQDDIPVQSDQTRQGYVEEEALTGGNTDTSDVSGINGDGDDNNAVWSGTLSGLASFGADQPGTYTINMVTTGLPVLTSEGATVLYSVSGNVLTGYVESGGTSGYQSGEDRAIFTLSITDTTSGSYSFTLHDQLDHTYGDNTETLLDLNLSSAIQAKDRDGDQITLGSSALLITVQDDIPIPVSQSPIIVIEGAAAIGTSAGAANLLANDKGGADLPIWIHAFYFYEKIGDLTTTPATVAKGGSTSVKTRYGNLQVWSDGRWSYTPDIVTHVNLPEIDTFSYKITDADGDVSTSRVTQEISVADTAPVIGTATRGILYETIIVPGVTSTETSGILSQIPGKDTYKVTFNNSSPPSALRASIAEGDPSGIAAGDYPIQFNYGATPLDSTFVTGFINDGENPSLTVCTVSITNPTNLDAGYTFTLYRPLLHTTELIDVLLSYKITDYDGTVVSSTSGEKISVIVVDSTIHALPTTGDDTLLFDTSLVDYHMGSGNDRLLLTSSKDITFDVATVARISDLEIIDLTVEGVNRIISLDVADVAAIASSNTLYILGTGEDSVALSSVMEQGTSAFYMVDGHSYSMAKYSGGGATVYVQNDPDNAVAVSQY